MLQLQRPLVVFDLEATGTDPQEARIIQIAARRIASDGGALSIKRTYTQLVDPGVPIPEAVTELTGITDADVGGKPSIAELIEEIELLFGGADVAGFNAFRFDLPLLKAELDRVGHPMPGPDDREVLDVLRLEQVLRPRSLEALYRRYTGHELSGAHDAAVDVDGTLAVLQGQLETHDVPARTPAELAKLIRGDYLDDGRKLKQRPDGAVEVCFGKHQGKTLSEIQEEAPGYLDWMRREITELKAHIDAALD